MNHFSKYIIAGLLILFSLPSCYKDDTTSGTNQLTELEIVFPDITQSEINIEKNETLTVDPEIMQKGKEKELKYEWQVNYEVFSTEKKLVFQGTRLGTYVIRLKATNEDGSAFKTITLSVNSPYEEGLMVLGENEQGDGELAFMRKYSPAELAAGKVESFVNNVFALNNRDQKIGKGPTDIVKRQKQVYISSREEGKIYFLNDKTFELEATVSAPDLPDFKPVAMNVPDGAFRTAAILCENGKLFDLALLEYLVMPNTKYPQDILPRTDFGFDFNDCFNYFWDPAINQIRQVSAYYTTNSLTAFDNQELVNFFYDDRSLYVITRDKTDPSVYTKTVFSYYVQNLSTKALDIKQKVTLNVSGSPALNPQSVLRINSAFKKLIYADGNKVYSWFYTGTDMSSAPFITIDAGTVTAMEQSPDGKELYVGVYNPGASGLKGSIHVYDMDTGSLIKKHESVVDKPVKIFYKKKN